MTSTSNPGPKQISIHEIVADVSRMGDDLIRARMALTRLLGLIRVEADPTVDPTSPLAQHAAYCKGLMLDMQFRYGGKP